MDAGADCTQLAGQSVGTAKAKEIHVRATLHENVAECYFFRSIGSWDVWIA